MDDGRSTHGSPELDEDAEKLRQLGADPGPTWDDLDDEDGDCPNCGGAGGYAQCMDDCCPYEGGEDECDDPACWRRCGWCNGKG